MNEIKLTYLTSGVGSFLQTSYDLFQSPVESFLVGDLAGFTVEPSEVMPRGDVTFTGGRQHVRSKLSNNDKDLQVTMIIPEENNDVRVGNVVVYARNRGVLKPALSIVLPQSIVKQDAFPRDMRDPNIHYPSSRLIINFSLTYVEEGELLSDVVVNLVSPTFSVLPFFGDLADVPPPALNPYAQFVVNRVAEHNRPALVTKDEADRYWTSPLWQDMNSPKYGVVYGGVQGDQQEGRPVWLWGGLYTTMNDPNDVVLGGLDYETETNRAVVVGGSSY